MIYLYNYLWLSPCTDSVFKTKPLGTVESEESRHKNEKNCTHDICMTASNSNKLGFNAIQWVHIENRSASKQASHPASQADKIFKLWKSRAAVQNSTTTTKSNCAMHKTSSMGITDTFSQKGRLLDLNSWLDNQWTLQRKRKKIRPFSP